MDESTDAQAVAGLLAAFREITGLSADGLAYYGPLTPEHLLAAERADLEPMRGLWRQFGYTLGRAWVLLGQAGKARPLIDEIGSHLPVSARSAFKAGSLMGVQSGRKVLEGAERGEGTGGTRGAGSEDSVQNKGVAASRDMMPEGKRT